VNALMQKPDLLKYDPRLVYREVSKSAGLGLLLDPQLGEAYLVDAYNYKTQKTEPQLRIGYKGVCKLSRQAGDVTNIYAHEVCENDPIIVRMGTDKCIDHTPQVFSDRGPVVGFYAVIKFKDGTFDFECMTVAQCQSIRDRSDGWKAYKAGKIKSTPWFTDEEEMSKKTVLRRLLKRQPQSPDLSEAIKIEDDADYAEMRSISHAREAVPALPPNPRQAAAIEHKQAAPAAFQTYEQGELVGFGAVEEATTIEQADPKPQDRQQAVEEAQERRRDAAEDEEPTPLPAPAKRTAPPAEAPKPAEGRPKPNDDLELPGMLDRRKNPDGPGKRPAETFNRPADPAADPKKFRDWIDQRLARIGPAEADTLETVWNDDVAPFLDGLFPPDVEDCLAILRAHEQRLAP
jgi:phage RecT family recombinase